MKTLSKLSVVLSTLVFLSVIGCAHLKETETKSLVNPFSDLVPKNRPIESKYETCSVVPAPVIDVMSTTYYEDSHHSIIDPKRHEQSREMVKPLRTFNNQIARLSDQIWKANDQGAEDCLFNWLNTWTQAGALLGNANYQGEFERKWNLSGIALSYLKIETLLHWSPSQKKTVVDWIEKIAKQVRADYNQKLDRQSRRNNHIYWAGLSVMAAAIGTGDRDLYLWGLERTRMGVMDVTQEGFLPEELDRAQRARHYQSFALQALTMAAMLANKNGTDFYSLNNQALRRLVQKTVEGYKDDSVFEKVTSIKQEAIDPKDFDWSVAYLYMNPDSIDVKKLDERKDIFSPWLGGDLSRTFSTN